MVLRSAGEVGCAHCTKHTAEQSCQVCTRLVCASCAADWATCSEPSGRVVRLGMAARVRDVDPLGRYALVSHWRQPLRLFDLRALAWVPKIRWERTIYLFWRQAPPRLTASGSLFYGKGRLNPDSPQFYAGMYKRKIATGTERRIHATIGAVPSHGTGVTAQGDLFYYVTDEQRVMIVPPKGAPGAYDTLPRKVIQAVAVDGERMLIASASWSEYALHTIDPARGLVRIAHERTELEGTVYWIGIAGEWLVAAVGDPRAGMMHYEARRYSRERGLGAVERRIAVRGPVGASAIARDGQHLAIGARDQLVVYGLDDDTTTTFDGHSDRINYLRFASEDHVLVSADTDNRVIMRPRSKTGYARPLLPVDVA